MADNNVFSVRLDEQDKDKLLELISESGKNNKEFMGTLISAYQLNKAKAEMPDIAKDIDGLEALTKRINQYYLNIGMRISDIQKSKDMEYEKDMTDYNEKISYLLDKNAKLENEVDSTIVAYNNLHNEAEDLNKKILQLEEIRDNNRSLISEYKDKNDTLTGLLNEYKKYKDEIKEYKKLLSDSQSKNIDLENIIKEKDLELSSLSKDNENLKISNEKAMEDMKSRYEDETLHIAANHKDEIEKIKDKAALEMDKALLLKDKEHQKEIEGIQIKHNLEIAEYQAKYKELLNGLEKLKSKPTK
ncbi:MAG: hypothetical protein ACERKV_01145 [Clostridiaceae bacterium]